MPADYIYNDGGYLTRLTASAGRWTFTYDDGGQLVEQHKEQQYSSMGTSTTKCPAPYAADYMLYAKCKTDVDTAQGSKVVMRKPSPRATLTGGSVMGITNDGCSAPIAGDYPESWLNFRPACDAHDYGYGLVRNKGINGWTHGLPRNKRTHVDAVFHTILKERICAGQKGIHYAGRATMQG